MNRSARVLVVGRSPGVLLETVEILRAKGYFADATNQFDQVLDDYDVTTIDVLVFGGMVPADTKQYLRQRIAERNPHVTFVQGLAGIAGLIAAQVDEAVGEAVGGQPRYDAACRSVELTLEHPAHVSVHAWWATSFAPPEPKSASVEVFDGDLDEGSHIIALPDHMPFQAAFTAVAVGSSVHVFTVGAMPDAVTRMVPASATDQRLPEVGRVTTRGDDR